MVHELEYTLCQFNPNTYYEILWVFVQNSSGKGLVFMKEHFGGHTLNALTNRKVVSYCLSYSAHIINLISVPELPTYLPSL